MTSKNNAIVDLLNSVLPATRSYIILIIFCTVVHLIGLPAPEYFGLDWSKLHHFWRPFTSVGYFGTPSMSMANSIYFLVLYGQGLEKLIGSVEHAWFLLVQIGILNILGLLLGFPFQSKALVTSIVYCSSQQNPLEKMCIILLLI
jgi:hypothetical protein